MTDPIKAGDKVVVAFTGVAQSGSQWGQIEILVDKSDMSGEDAARKIYIQDELVKKSPSVLESLFDSKTVANPTRVRAIESGES